MDDGVLVITRHKLDVDDYHRMAEAGIIGWKERVELIEGELIDMAPIGNDHAYTVDGLNRMLVLACEGKAVVSVQNPVRLDRFSEPQPDFGVFRLKTGRYRTARPTPADTLLLIEVSDSSVRFDRRVKLPLYARAGIAEFWIVDLGQRVLDAYRDPAADGYAAVTRYGPGDRIALSMAPEISLLLEGVFD